MKEQSTSLFIILLLLHFLLYSVPLLLRYNQDNIICRTALQCFDPLLDNLGETILYSCHNPSSQTHHQNFYKCNTSSAQSLAFAPLQLFKLTLAARSIDCFLTSKYYVLLQILSKLPDSTLCYRAFPNP